MIFSVNDWGTGQTVQFIQFKYVWIVSFDQPKLDYMENSDNRPVTSQQLMAAQFTERNPFVDKLSIYSRLKTILYTYLWEAIVVKIKSGVEWDELISSKLQKWQRLKQLEWMRLLWTTNWSDKEGSPSWGSLVTHFSINRTAWSVCSHVTILFWALSCCLLLWTRLLCDGRLKYAA